MGKSVKSNRAITSRRWIYLFLGVIIMMCLGTVYAWSIFRLPIEEIYNISSAQSGFPYMVSLAFYALFMFFTGKHIDKFSPRKIILFGGGLVAIGWILSAYAPNIYVLTLTYGIITGAGVGIVYGVPISVITKWFPDKTGLIVGIVLVGFGLSPLITAPIARYIVENYGVMNAFLILGISFAILLPLLSLSFTYPTEYEILPQKSTTLRNVKDVNSLAMIKEGNFKGLYLSFMFGTMIGLMIIGMTNNVGAELIQLPSNKIALLMSLFAVFNGIGRPLFGWITDKISYKKSMLISYLLIIFAALLMLRAKEGDVVLYSIAFSIFWFNLGGWLAIAPTSTLSMYGVKYYSQNYGVVFTAYGIGAVIGVLLSGLIKDAFQNYYSVFYFVIILCVMGLFTSQLMMKEYKLMK